MHAVGRACSARPLSNGGWRNRTLRARRQPRAPRRRVLLWAGTGRQRGAPRSPQTGAVVDLPLIELSVGSAGSESFATEGFTVRRNRAPVGGAPADRGRCQSAIGRPLGGVRWQGDVACLRRATFNRITRRRGLSPSPFVRPVSKARIPRPALPLSCGVFHGLGYVGAGPGAVVAGCVCDGPGASVEPWQW